MAVLLLPAASFPVLAAGGGELEHAGVHVSDTASLESFPDLAALLISNRDAALTVK